MLIVGKTGSGKSTIEEKIINKFAGHSVIVIDPKCDEMYDDYLWTDDYKALPSLAKSNAIVVYRPPPIVVNANHYDIVLKWIYDRGNTVVVIDEVYGLTPTPNNIHSYPAWLTAIYTRGRTRGITTIACSQRPKGMPVTVRSENEYFLVFELGTKDDRRCMADELGEDMLVIPPEYAFWFSHKRSKPLLLRAKL